ncbi:MAG TPA: hypothetical protein VF007_03515, partial [Stellaceae bacterium]
MPVFISGYRTTTYVLNNPPAQNPATVTQYGTINVNSAVAYTPGILGTNGFPWTLTNNGTVQSVGNQGVGVNFQAGGSIANTPVAGTAGLVGGIIRATGNAVQITGGAGTVSNSGTISQIGAGLANGVQLNNGGSVNNSGLISGGFGGINVSNAAGAVSNFGTISATAGTALNFANGGSVNNAGLITASSTGVFFSGAGETVVNSGSIAATSAIILNIGGSINNSGLINSGAGGVTVNNAIGTLTNTGSITGTGEAVRLNAGGSVTNGVSGSGAGLIRGATGGVYAFLNPSTVTNFGTIQQAGSFAADAVYLAGGGTVTNAGLISAGFDGIDIRNSGTVVNSGIIQGGGSGNFAGIFLSGSSFLVTNTGVITSTAPGVIMFGSGTVNNGAGASITGAPFGVTISGVGTVANSGTITGTTTSGTTFGDGVAVNAIGGRIANTGLITRGASGAGTINGAGAFFAGGTLTNSGTISDPTANNGSGVQVGTGGGYINNSGLITAYHSGVGFFNSGTLRLVNSGTIRSTETGPAAVTGFAGFAVNAGSATSVTITNSGLIAASQTAGGGGVILNGGGTVINQAGATINGAGGNGVFSQAGGIVTNSGAILSALSTAVGLRGSAGTVTNFGTIAHTGLGTTGSAIYLGAGGAIANYGLVSGAWPGAPVPVGYPGAINVDNQPITIRNLGTVTNPNSSNGINLDPGGRIVNGSPSATGATISAMRTGIYVGGRENVPYPNAPGLITNYGSIISTGRNGISMVSGGTITNRGLITGYRNGISLTSAAGTIANFGTIAHTGGGTVGEAIYLGAGGVVTNYGLLSGASPGAPAPVGYPGVINADNQAASVTNLGTITNPNNGNGVNLLRGGTLINGSPTATSALIFAPHGGVYMGGKLGTLYPGAVGNVTNYGAIINTGSGGQAIRMVSGGTVTNHGAIASGRTGISFGNTAGTVDNFGAIASSAPTSFTAGSGVYLENGGQITNEAGGSITAQRAAISLGGTATTSAGVLVTNSGVVAGDVGVKIGLGDTGNNTIVNFGTIVGTSGTAIDLGNASASVVLEPGSQLQGGITNFRGSDSIDFAGVSAFSLNYVGGSLTLFNQTTPVAQVSVSTPYVNPQFSEASDGAGGTLVTVTPPGGPVMFDFIYRYSGSADYYYGKVADDGTFGYSVGQQIATGAGKYTILNQEPGAVSAPAGSVFVTYLSHAGQGESSPTPLKFAGGQPDGTGGLGSESDAVIGTDGQPHAFSSAAPPSFSLDQLFGFIFSYADGSTFYTGTVADDGSFGYGAIADGSGVKQIFDSSGKFQGYYAIYREGPTDQPAGKVVINRYFSGQAGQSFDVDQSMSGGSNGLGSETGVIVVNGQQVTFGDPPEAVLPATNPALALPVIDTSDPTAAAAQIYQQILGRAPDSAGLAVYAGALA